MRKVIAPSLLCCAVSNRNCFLPSVHVTYLLHMSDWLSFMFVLSAEIDVLSEVRCFDGSNCQVDPEEEGGENLPARRMESSRFSFRRFRRPPAIPQVPGAATLTETGLGGDIDLKHFRLDDATGDKEISGKPKGLAGCNERLWSRIKKGMVGGMGSVGASRKT